MHKSISCKVNLLCFQSVKSLTYSDTAFISKLDRKMFTKQTIAKRGKLNEDFRAVFSIAPHHNSDKVDLARAAFRFSSKVEHFNNCPFRTKNKKKKKATQWNSIFDFLAIRYNYYG